MGTVVTMEVLGQGGEEAIGRAFRWFDEVERTCTRFDPASELMGLTAQAGRAVPVSPILFEAVQFAICVAEETGGAFDPTIGSVMEARGFNREYRTGAVVRTELAGAATYRDIETDSGQRTILFRRPLLLDLGAVAKGLAIDAAARELEPFTNFAIYAGGDLYLGGCNAEGKPWHTGIRHPRLPSELIASLRITNRAVCTSGDYERPGHVLDPRCGETASGAISATVIAPTALVADALATAAFVLGPRAGIDLCHRAGVEALIVAPDLEIFETEGLRHAA
jgi:thiamine biosynthesis lipoprotein